MCLKVTHSDSWPQWIYTEESKGHLILCFKQYVIIYKYLFYDYIFLPIYTVKTYVLGMPAKGANVILLWLIMKYIYKNVFIWISLPLNFSHNLEVLIYLVLLRDYLLSTILSGFISGICKGCYSTGMHTWCDCFFLF